MRVLLSRMYAMRSMHTEKLEASTLFQNRNENLFLKLKDRNFRFLGVF